MTRYMHTLEGQPATFYKNSGVCFTHKRIRLANSLRQIRREQAACKAMRAEEGAGNDFKYGYVTVAL